MSFKQNVEHHLQHFAQSIGLGELKLNEHDACGLCFDDTMVVNMEYLAVDEALVMVASVRQVSIHDNTKVEVFEKMLALNLQHHGMQGAFLALNHDKTEALLLRSLQASCDYGLFESTLEKFVNTLEWCILELDPSKQAEAPTPKTPPQQGQGPNSPPGDNMGMMV